MSSSSSGSSLDVQSDLFDGLAFKIIDAKLTGEQIEGLVTSIEQSGGRTVVDVNKADVIVCAVHTRSRLERHISWDVAKTKTVITPKWVEDSLLHETMMAVVDYIPVEELKQQPSGSNVRGVKTAHPKVETSVPRSQSEQLGIGSSNTRSTSRTIHGHSDDAGSSSANHIAYEPRYKSVFACQRHSPLVCPNQDLIGELLVIKRAREVDGDMRSMLSYARAISGIKAYPRRIKFIGDVDTIPYIGPKTRGMIQQFLQSGRIKHADEIRSSTRYQTLMTFIDIPGIGHSTAQKLYDLGLRTVRDLMVYADVDDLDDNQLAIVPSGGRSHGAKRLTWPESLKIFDDLNVKIPRDEVEEVAERVLQELRAIMPGSDLTICGGYRRGKLESNDIDLIFTHPEGPGQEKLASDLATKLTKRLHQAGIVTHVMHLPSFRNRQGVHLRPANRKGWDKLEKVMTVMKLPPRDDEHRRHRRVDLVYAPREVYGCAIVGWTGSIQFERDIRLWAKQKMQMKFDSSGITRLRDTKNIPVSSEREVFKVLGLDYVDPVLRNAE